MMLYKLEKAKLKNLEAMLLKQGYVLKASNRILGRVYTKATKWGSQMARISKVKMPCDRFGNYNHKKGNKKGYFLEFSQSFK